MTVRKTRARKKRPAKTKAVVRKSSVRKKRPRKRKAPPKLRERARRKKVPPRSPKVPRSRRTPSEGEPDLGGRPAIDWDGQAADDVYRLALVGNTVADMAWILGVSKSALESAIAEIFPIKSAYQQGRADRRDDLRTAQTRSALSGNATMLIWLGKQELGQRDVKAVEIMGPGGEPVPLSHDLAPVVKQRVYAYLRSKGKALPEEEVEESQDG